ncbi:MAG TPA: hypothetical protein VJM11_11875 [Nevskiaceae bacterium]|nr:hypothetical protein [Nevskiaceae bacterium]
MSAAWREQRERSTPFMLRLIVGVARRAGRRATRWLLIPIVGYFLLTGGAARRASREFLRRALGREPTWRDVVRHFHAFASCALDRVFLLGDRHTAFDIRSIRDPGIPDPEHRGCVVIVSHLGSFEVMRVPGVRDENLPIRIVMDRSQNPAMTAMLEALDPALAADVIDSAVGGPTLLVQLKAALQAGHLVGLMGDRVRGAERTAAVEFFGERAHLPVTPWILAGTLKVPVLLGFGLYRGGDRYDVHYERYSDALDLPREQRQAALERHLQAYAARLEHHARSAPYNWFNFYPFWTHEPASD